MFCLQIENYFQQACNLSYDIEEMRKENFLIYNMVPKCGSLSMRRILHYLAPVLNYTKGHLPYYKDTWEHNAFHHNHSFISHQLNQDIIKLKQKHHMGIYVRHLHFVDFSEVTDDHPNYINLIRDPVDHYISWYIYRRYGAFGSNFGPLLGNGVKQKYYRSDEWQQLKNMSFAECVLSEHEECKNYTFTFRLIPYFCGNYDFCLKPSTQSLLRAMDNVINYFPIVGYLENMDQYYELTEKIWPQFFNGSRLLFEQKMNESKDLQHKTEERTYNEPSEKVKEIMRKRLKYEYLFYNWIKVRFQCMYNKYVLSI